MSTSNEKSFYINPFMPGDKKMYRQRAKNSNFSDFDDHEMCSCAKNYIRLPSSLFLGMNGLTLFHMIRVFKGPRMTICQLFLNRFCEDDNMFRNLYQIFTNTIVTRCSGKWNPGFFLFVNMMKSVFKEPSMCLVFLFIWNKVKVQRMGKSISSFQAGDFMGYIDS